MFSSFSWSRHRHCSFPCYLHLIYFTCMHTSHFWRWPTSGQYACLKWRLGRSAQNENSQWPAIKSGFTDFLDFNQPNLVQTSFMGSHIISGSIKVKWLGQGHMAIFVSFHNLFAFYDKVCGLWPKYAFLMWPHIGYIIVDVKAQGLLAIFLNFSIVLCYFAVWCKKMWSSTKANILHDLCYYWGKKSRSHVSFFF